MNWRAQSRRLLPYFVVALAGFLTAYLIAAFVIFPAEIVPSDGPVPTVVGLDFDDASRKLTAAGFEAATGETRFSADVPKATVLSQSPPAGSREPRGATITLDVSAGQRSIEVPPVVGLTQALAQASLETAGLEVGEVSERESGSARGAVIETMPAAGDLVPPSTPVRLVISSGPAAVATPDVVGQSFDAARAMLIQVGLRLGATTVDSTALGGSPMVIAQSPAAGASVRPGTRVDLTITGGTP